MSSVTPRMLVRICNKTIHYEENVTLATGLTIYLCGIIHLQCMWVFNIVLFFFTDHVHLFLCPDKLFKN